MLAKPYPVSRAKYTPQIANLHHCCSKGAHEVLGAVSETHVSFAYKNHFFHCLLLNLSVNHALSICSPYVMHWPSNVFIDSIHILLMLYLLLWSCFPTSQNLQDFIKAFRALIEDILSQ